MNQKEFQKFVSYLVENYKVYSPQEEEGQTIIKELSDAKEAALIKKLPFYAWKKFFVPEEETLFEYENEQLTPPLPPPPIQTGNQVACNFFEIKKRGIREKVALLGINVLDLRAVLLYDLVFASDPYYQARRENILIIGFGPEVELADGIIRKIEERDLAHLPFDIFLYHCHPERSGAETKDLVTSAEILHPHQVRGQNDKKAFLKVFVATQKGKKVLDEIGYKNYEKIEFIGHKYDDFLECKMNLRRDKMKNHHNPKIWEKLGKICLECGKCTIACPTCFCFRIDDSSSLKTDCGTRQRCWDSCFYQEFSEITGAHKFLNNTAQRIHFWYFHKFARIPDEYKMMGCVGCNRCHQVCPVGIDIKEVLEKIEKS